MKIELVEEQRFNGEPWYIIQVDGQYVKGTGNKLVAEKMYNEIITDPNILKTKINILKSEDIDLSLVEPNQ
jgi:hypothetical protein